MKKNGGTVMEFKTLNGLHFGDLTTKLPIIQGGMGVGISLSGLASAVAGEGGIGVIATAGIGIFEPDFIKDFLGANIRALQKEIKKARAKSDGVVGVNIMVALSNFADMARTAIQEGRVYYFFRRRSAALSAPIFGGNPKNETGSDCILSPGSQNYF
jgi:nitronate monooxygenase